VTLLVRGETIEDQMSRYLVDRCCSNPAVTPLTDTRIVRAYASCLRTRSSSSSAARGGRAARLGQACRGGGR
jgi:hypothetical protein